MVKFTRALAYLRSGAVHIEKQRLVTIGHSHMTPCEIHVHLRLAEMRLAATNNS
jgi:hypothetical protein